MFVFFQITEVDKIKDKFDDKKTPSQVMKFDFGERRIRTFEGVANRFTVWPL